MSHLTDRELIAAASKGQVAAFVSLIDRYRDVRTRFAMRMLGDYDTADDALQAAFVRAFQTIGRYRNADRFEEWLFRIIINECRARALRRTVQSRRPTGEVDALADWRAAVEGNDNGADVQRALDQIDPINREAFVLQYVEELTYPQIAILTGVSVITLDRQGARGCVDAAGAPGRPGLRPPARAASQLAGRKDRVHAIRRADPGDRRTVV